MKSLLFQLTAFFVSSTMEKGRLRVIRSSLPYQMILYLNAWYFALFFLCEVLMLVFKGETLPYPNTGSLAGDIILVIVLLFVEIARILTGMKGNLTERIFQVVLSLALTAIGVVIIVYLLLWQTYTLRAELILCVILGVFYALEFIFGIVSIITFGRANPY